jgi:hypothetical protein
MKTKELRKWAKRIARDTDAMVVLAYLLEEALFEPKPLHKQWYLGQMVEILDLKTRMPKGYEEGLIP